jgi:hypothetical protein
LGIDGMKYSLRYCNHVDWAVLEAGNDDPMLGSQGRILIRDTYRRSKASGIPKGTTLTVRKYLEATEVKRSTSGPRYIIDPFLWIETCSSMHDERSSWRGRGTDIAREAFSPDTLRPD